MLARLVNFIVTCLFLLSGATFPAAASILVVGTLHQIQEKKATSSFESYQVFSAAIEEDENDEVEESVFVQSIPNILNTSTYFALNWIFFKSIAVEEEKSNSKPIYIQCCNIRC